MKKITALILALMMACLMLPALAEEDVTGDWYLQSMSAGGMSINPADMGMSMKLTLNAGGTYAMVSGEDAEEGPWEPVEPWAATL